MENDYVQPSRIVTAMTCRVVGPGGTRIMFIVDDAGTGIDCVWEHENCPYQFDGDPRPDEYGRAYDRHNVTKLTRSELEAMLESLREVK